jgi:hypothetical protein
MGILVKIVWKVNVSKGCAWHKIGILVKNVWKCQKWGGVVIQSNPMARASDQPGPLLSPTSWEWSWKMALREAKIADM